MAWTVLFLDRNRLLSAKFNLVISTSVRLTICPGFGHDRVNFHQKPGGDTESWNHRIIES